MPITQIKAEDIAKDLRDSLGEIGEIPGGYAYLGKGDGTGTIIYDSARRLVYCYDGYTVFVVPVAQGIHFPSMNKAELVGKRVRLGYPSYNKNRLHLTGFDSDSSLAGLGGVLPGEQYTSNLVLPDVGSIANFRGYPTAPDASTEVYISGGAYYDQAGQWAWFGGDETTDLTAAIAALTSGQHQMAVIVVDKSTGELEVFTNTAETGTDKDLFDTVTLAGILDNKGGYDVVSAVHLYYGQTEIVENDFYRNVDPRIALSSRTVEYTASVTTTDNTQTTLASVAISELQMATITATVNGAKSDYSAAIGGTAIATVRRATGGNVTLVGSTSVTSNEDSAGTPSFTIDVDTGTQTARIRVTGITAETWNWATAYKVVLN